MTKKNWKLLTTELDISLKEWHHIIFSDYFAIFKVDSYDSLPIEKLLTLHNVIIHIKSILNKDKNHYYLKIFLEKCLPIS